MFWDNVIYLCTKKGISLNAMCSEIGLSNATATKWKKGAIPHDITLKRIADFFDVSVEHLLNNTDESQTKNHTLEKILTLLRIQKKKQKDLTDFLGISKNSFTSWKSGANTSYLKYISKIAEFLGVSTDYLLGTQKENPAANSDEALMFALWGGDTSDITSEMLADVRKFAQFIREKKKDDSQ